MTTLTEQIEQLRLQIKEVAYDERTLVKELANAFRQADEKLLQEVRLVAAEHEVRRCTILRELEMLASRIGVLPHPPTPRTTIADALPHVASHAAVRRHPSSNNWEPHSLWHASVN